MTLIDSRSTSRFAKCSAPLILALAFATSGCSSKENSESYLPDDFSTLPASGQVEFLMHRISPDSMARFICNASIGKIPGVKMDLNQATLYAFEHYSGKDMDAFATEFDQYPKTLPLADKMLLYKNAGTEDPQGLGYTLGLEYIQTIRQNNKNISQVRDELNAFRKACGSDSATYRRFIIGFKTALKADHGKDLSEAVYNEFINYEENI